MTLEKVFKDAEVFYKNGLSCESLKQFIYDFPSSYSNNELRNIFSLLSHKYEMLGCHTDDFDLFLKLR